LPAYRRLDEATLPRLDYPRNKKRVAKLTIRGESDYFFEIPARLWLSQARCISR